MYDVRHVTKWGQPRNLIFELLFFTFPEGSTWKKYLQIRISLEFDASGTGFEAFFGGFLLVDTVLDFLKCYIVDYFHHKKKFIREIFFSST